jgi:1-acyl-sn-glycerol-3-phosphate acyltransferase
MQRLTDSNEYRSPDRRISGLSRKFPSLCFYRSMLPYIWKASRLAKKGQYSTERWIHDTLSVMRDLESVGISFEVENLGAFRNLKTPCVFISNHMSTLETFVLPCLIVPDRNITFVVMAGLLKFPVFKHIMASRDPIILPRDSARRDLETVLKEGQVMLKQNISVVIFPQGTRTLNFDAIGFSSIGVKLAKHAGVPVIPIAVRTDAWGNKGFPINYFGRIDPTKPVRMSFGDPIYVHGNGKQEHEIITYFITDKLRQWFETS